VITGATQRHTFGALQILGLRPREQVNQSDSVQPVAWRKVRGGIELRVAVPRADQLAVVAAEDAVADQRPQVFRNVAVMLDRQIRDAASGIEAIRRNDGLRRADVDAGAARAAMGADRGLCRRCQRQVGVDLAEEKPRAGLAIQQQGVLADPAEPGVAGQRLFEHRRTVGEHAITMRRDGFRHPLGQLLQPAPHQLVIVAAQRVARDVGRFRVGQHGLGVLSGWAIVEPRADHRHRARQQPCRRFAQARMLCHPRHPAMQPVVEPALQMGAVVIERLRGDAGIGEAEFTRPDTDLRGPVGERRSVVR